MKICWSCGEDDENAFYRTSTKDGRCKKCRRLDAKKRYKPIPRKSAEPRGEFRYRINYLYGLSIDRYDDLVIEHVGRCYICGSDDAKNKGICVDHCHETGKIRGLLCRKCNAGMGAFDDQPELIRKVLYYLENC